MTGAADKRFKLLSDLVALTGAQLLSMIAGFAAFAYLARTLNPAQYGMLEFAVGLSVIFAMVIDWGLGPVSARTVIRRPDRIAELAALVPSARLGIALVAIPVMGLWVTWSGHDDETVRLVWLFAIALLALPWKQDWLLQGLDRMHAVALGQPLRMLVFAAGAVLLVRGPDDLLWVGFVEIAALLSAALFYVVVQGLWVTPIRMKFALPAIRSLLADGLSVGLVNVVWALIQFLPMLVLASQVGGTETAWMGASLRIVLALLAVCVAYHFNLYPAVAQRLGQPSELKALLGASLRVTSWVGISGALAICLLAEPIVVIAFGERFEDAATTLAILIWAVPVTLLSGHARWTLIAMGRQRDVLLANVAGAITVLVLSLLLVPVWRADGAAIAVVAATLMVWILSHARVRASVAGLLPLGAVGLSAAAALTIWVATILLDSEGWLIPMLAGGACLLSGFAVDRALLPSVRFLASAKSRTAASGSIQAENRA